MNRTENFLNIRYDKKVIFILTLNWLVCETSLSIFQVLVRGIASNSLTYIHDIVLTYSWLYLMSAMKWKVRRGNNLIATICEFQKSLGCQRFLDEILFIQFYSHDKWLRVFYPNFCLVPNQKHSTYFAMTFAKDAWNVLWCCVRTRTQKCICFWLYYEEC